MVRGNSIIGWFAVGDFVPDLQVGTGTGGIRAGAGQQLSPARGNGVADLFAGVEVGAGGHDEQVAVCCAAGFGKR